MTQQFSDFELTDDFLREQNSDAKARVGSEGLNHAEGD